MRTEEQIVYELMNIYHGGEITNDTQIDERLMRGFLRKHRASKISKATFEGLTVPSEIFQRLGTVTLEKNEFGDYEVDLPALLRLQGHGINIYKTNYSLPVISREGFRLSKRNIINKSFPKATLFSNKLIIYPGNSDLCNADATSEKEVAVKAFADEIAEFDDNEKITVEVEAVLYDPGQAPDYDWTSDPYPCMSEIIDELTTSTLARDLNLMIRQFVDQNDDKRFNKAEVDESL